MLTKSMENNLLDLKRGNAIGKPASRGLRILWAGSKEISAIPLSQTWCTRKDQVIVRGGEPQDELERIFEGGEQRKDRLKERWRAETNMSEEGRL